MSCGGISRSMIGERVITQEWIEMPLKPILFPLEERVTGEKECEDLTVLKWISVDSVIVWESGEETQ